MWFCMMKKCNSCTTKYRLSVLLIDSKCNIATDVENMAKLIGESWLNLSPRFVEGFSALISNIKNATFFFSKFWTTEFSSLDLWFNERRDRAGNVNISAVDRCHSYSGSHRGWIKDVKRHTSFVILPSLISHNHPFTNCVTIRQCQQSKLLKISDN